LALCCPAANRDILRSLNENAYARYLGRFTAYSGYELGSSDISFFPWL
jgi:hypothetical protein